MYIYTYNINEAINNILNETRYNIIFHSKKKRQAAQSSRDPMGFIAPPLIKYLLKLCRKPLFGEPRAHFRRGPGLEPTVLTPLKLRVGRAHQDFLIYFYLLYQGSGNFLLAISLKYLFLYIFFLLSILIPIFSY